MLLLSNTNEILQYVALHSEDHSLNGKVQPCNTLHNQIIDLPLRK